jgi:hypothetical protein
VLGALLLTGAGCPGSLDDPARFLSGVGGDGSACPDIPTTVFVPICATAGCHTAADKIQGLDLQSPDAASRLVGACARGGGLLVDPANPSDSVVYTKLTFTPPFGSRMPLGKPPLDDATTACVLAWISAQNASTSPCGADASPDAP